MNIIIREHRSYKHYSSFIPINLNIVGKYCDNLDVILNIYSQGKVVPTYCIKYLLNSYQVKENDRRNKKNMKIPKG